jgi:hypothetical protein
MDNAIKVLDHGIAALDDYMGSVCSRMKISSTISWTTDTPLLLKV